ncbi:hypothetical protein [Nocardioides sp.]|uniref:hypothetical protein n=1 Tax=Nocardioides sp. TaxID=35761 RepID=UPI00261CBB36|nr:hypothetical protein [Nocardioides sp.]
MSIVAETATLAHGYTMAHIENIAWKAAHRERWLDPEEAHDAAWHAIVMRLYDGDEAPPTSLELYTTGLRATQIAVRQHNRAHGYGEELGGQRPSFGKYWLPVSGPKSDFTDSLCERMALPQVLSVLTPTEYEAIATLAVHETPAAAAAALRISTNTFYERVRRARLAARAAWFDLESPPDRSIKRTDGTEQCRSGHPRSKYGEKLENGHWKCCECGRISGRKKARKRAAELGRSD